MPHRAIRLAIGVLESLIGLGGIGGGIAVLTGAFGFDQWLPTSFLEGTPFPDYSIPGLLLLIVIGGGMLLAAGTVFVQRAWAVLFSATMGMVMVGFEAVEAAIIDRNAQAVVPPTVVQQVLLAGLGLVIFGLASFLWISEGRGQHVPARHA